jgi:hypothetical protein
MQMIHVYLALTPNFRIATRSRRGARKSWQPQDTTWDKSCNRTAVSSRPSLFSGVPVNRPANNTDGCGPITTSPQHHSQTSF